MREPRQSHSSAEWEPMPSIEPDGLESDIINTSSMTVLFALRPGPDLMVARRQLAEHGLMVAEQPNIAAISRMSYVPRFAFVELGFDGGLELIRRLSSPPDEVQVVAVLGAEDEEVVALDAGAVATLHRPLVPAAVIAHMRRLQRHLELVTRSRELFERNAEGALASTTARVTSAISHEIRNPLASARANVGLLLEAQARERAAFSFEEQREMLQEIDEALGRVDDTLRSLGVMARGQKPSVESVNLTLITKRAIAALPTPPFGLTLQASPDVRGMGAGSMLGQVIQNVVKNAIDAVRGVDKPMVMVRVYETAGEARVSIRDNGPGIPRELRERIFEPFFSTKSAVGGTGLGLAIARQAMASMGGALTLSETETQGACFRVRLPRG